MTKVVVGMTMSVDGYVEDRTGGVGALFADLATLKETESLREDIENTGAVVMGRKAFDMAKDPDFYADNYEFQVPIFVLTHRAPRRHPRETDRLSFTFVTDGVESAIRQAQRAAKGRQITSRWREYGLPMHQSGTGGRAAPRYHAGSSWRRTPVI